MISIITVYKSHNYGSYLQAKALYEVCKRFDKNVRFLDAGQRHFVTLDNLRWICRRLILDHDAATLRLFWNTFRYWSKMKSISLQSAKKRDDITYIVGSDEIWNVARVDCNLPIFRAEPVNGRIISYAPSINSATEEQLRKKNFEQVLERFSAISVRDTRSQEVLGRITGRDIPVVLDPTLLFDMDFYTPAGMRLKTFCKKYIALYLFDNALSSEQILIIREFAKEEDLLLVSIGLYMNWCDEVVPVPNFCPFLYYKDAKYVITNTFHGTAFAINFETQFITIPNGNHKTQELLQNFGLTDRNASEDFALETFIKRIEGTIDYTVVNKRKELERKKSLDFLQKNLTEQ